MDDDEIYDDVLCAQTRVAALAKAFENVATTQENNNSGPAQNCFNRIEHHDHQQILNIENGESEYAEVIFKDHESNGTPREPTRDDKGHYSRMTTVKEGTLCWQLKTTVGLTQWKPYWGRLISSKEIGSSLQLYANEKDILSKLVIRGSRMDVKTMECKGDESRPFRVVVAIKNREYVFSVPTAKEMCEWSMNIMKTVIDDKKSETRVIHHDKVGYLQLKMIEPEESGKDVLGSRFVSVSRAFISVYKDEDHFDCNPIFELDVKDAVVQDTPSRHLIIVFKNVIKLTFSVEDEAELPHWRVAVDDASRKAHSSDPESVWSQIQKNLSNRRCADCGQHDPLFAIVNWGIVVCQNCSLAHKELGETYSKVKPLLGERESWTKSLVELLVEIGNDNANKMWEHHLGQEKISVNASFRERTNFIVMKYKMRQFCLLFPMKEQDDLDKTLNDNVQKPHLLTSIQLIVTGANVNSLKGGCSTIEIARKSGQYLQETLLKLHRKNPFQLPGSVTVVKQKFDQSDTLSGKEKSTEQTKEVLFQTSLPRGNYTKYVGVLKGGLMTYFEDLDGTLFGKGEVSLSEAWLVTELAMPSPKVLRDDLYHFSVDVPGHTYIYAAETVEKLREWKRGLARNLLPPQLFVATDSGSTRFGKMMVKDMSMGIDSTESWVVLKGSALTIYTIKEEKVFDMQLRKTVYQVTDEEISGDVSHELLGYKQIGLQILLTLSEGRVVSLKARDKKETQGWLHFIMEAKKPGERIEEQLLSKNDVPVIVESCMDFVLLHGLSSKGIYRESGTESAVSALLARFRDDARAVKLRVKSDDEGKKDDQVHVNDVANVLKRFFRELPDSLLTSALHDKWCDLMMTKDKRDEMEQMRSVKSLVDQLPVVNRATLKALLLHLQRIASKSEENKMPYENQSTILALTLMGSNNLRFSQKAETIAFLLQHREWLFSITRQEAAKERKEFEDIVRLIQLTETVQVPTTDEHLSVTFRIETVNTDGESEKREVQIRLLPGMSAHETTYQALTGAGVTQSDPKRFALFESLANNQLERLVHYEEDVYALISTWQIWSLNSAEDLPQLVVKRNHVKETLRSLNLLTAPESLTAEEIYFSEKTDWKPYSVELSQDFLVLYGRNKRVYERWEVKELNFYLGVEEKRLDRRGSRQNKSRAAKSSGITFVKRGEPVVVSRDTPFVGHSLDIPDTMTYFQWLAGFLLLAKRHALSAPDSIPAPSARPPVDPRNGMGPRRPNHPAHVPGAVSLLRENVEQDLQRRMANRRE